VAAVSLVYELEVDVVRDRDDRPWRERTHHVTVAVPDQPSLTRADNEARNLATAMGHARGSMVTAVRIVGCQL
jgi:hypothetical protein